MENEEITVANELKAAFNDGYQIGLYRPQLVSVFTSNSIKEQNFSQSGTLQTFFSGLEEGVLTQKKNDQIEQHLRDLRSHRDLEKENNISPDID